MIVMRPVRYRPQSSSSFKNIGLCKKRHQRHKAAITSTVNTYACWINTEILHEVMRRVYFIIQVFSTHITINAGAPVAAIAGTSAVINVQNSIAFVSE